MKFDKSTGGDFPLQPAGTHLAVLFQLVDLGTQQVTYEGKTKAVRQVKLVFELHGEEAKLSDGRPMAISKTFSRSGHEKSGLRLFMEKWRGKKFTDEEIAEFDFRTMLGKPCLLNVVHKDMTNGTMAQIEGASRLMQGMAAPTPINDLLFVSLDEGEYDADAFNKLSAKVKEKIWPTKEYKALQGEPAAPVVDDDFPFDHA
jgi:hypothetical protein